MCIFKSFLLDLIRSILELLRRDWLYRRKGHKVNNLICNIYDCGPVKNLPTPWKMLLELPQEARSWLTSNDAIIIPHAGAILAIRGKMPAYNAEAPSLRITRIRRGRVFEMWVFDADMRRACRRVFSTSNGDVNRAAEIPLIAPLTKATHVPSWPRLAKDFFQFS